MKVTWFSGTVFRLQIGGRIVVTDARAAPAHIDPAELIGAADAVVSLDDTTLPALDAATWTPRRAPRLIDAEDGPAAPDILRAGGRGLLLDAAGEPPVLLCDAEAAPQWGRWADGAVIILCGSVRSSAESGIAVLAVARPKLIALAVDGDADAAFAAIAPHLGETGLMILEPALAVEV